ncbi:carbohydrate kinase family protein [Nocardioides sp. BP30]|uniref:carbohydrate kinase family protein n=1 Tax=Nocardioides sp. BP30 TaxID=3036374 RepID=UPI00246996F3|nr:carbohydrate kinase family protein [Nocardioides sp. BP30]WGL52675.1 carbohydrate kinase family protein [Nocardioides sp. BP30]
MSEPYVVVIGGANMDLHAQARADLVAGTSNPGSSQLSPGGVGRNIAEVIARLGTPCHLVSAVGDDPLGAELIAHTVDAGVDVTHVRQRPVATGTYAAILSPAGELVVAVADMAATDLVSPLAVEAAAGLIRGAGLLVLDGNLLPATVEHALEVARDADVSVVLDPVSVPKAERLRPTIGHGIGLVTPNRGELSALTGLPTRTPAQVDHAIERLHALGVPSVWVRLSEEGSILDTAAGRWPLSAPEVDLVDVTGAGDAMLGAFCHAVLGGADLLTAARYGHAAAALTVTSRSTVRTDLSDQLIRSML